MIACGMCGREFREDRGQPACRACPLSEGCGFVRCPHCGHENPASPGWVGRLEGWLERWSGGGEDAAASRAPEDRP